MPIYEFTCQSCKKQFDHLQRTMTEGPRPVCPDCGSKQTSRMLSVFAVAGESSKTSSSSGSPGMCGRCGGPPGSCRS